MERMKSLRETAARALAAHESAYDDRHWEAYTAQADAVLAALGLDDLDALTTRTLAEFEDGGRRLSDVDPWHIVWVVLKAAFTATEGTDDAR